MNGASGDEPRVPPEIEQALASDVELIDALRKTGLPLDFQAMVLGLATFRRLRPGRGSHPAGGPRHLP